MTLVIYKLLASILIFLVSIATVIYPLKNKSTFKHTESLGLGEALASGIFLGAAFFHMLPDAIHTFAQIDASIKYPIAEAICVGGFLFLLFLERLSFTFPAIQSKSTIPYMLAITLIIHALTEGAALGVGSRFSEAFMIFIAILAHKGSESFALCVILLKHQLPARHVFLIVAFFSLMSPLGIWLGTAINWMTLADHGELAAAVFNAFAAGSFLYISTLHHIHFHQHAKDSQGLVEFIFLLTGISAMGTIALWT